MFFLMYYNFEESNFFFFLKKAIFEIKYQSNLYIADENESL